MYRLDLLFRILTVVLAVAAAYFLYKGNREGAFVTIALACAAFFLGMRFQIKERNRTREAEEISEQ